MQLSKIHHIQQSFRAVMDAMARPGTLRAIPDYAADPADPERAVLLQGKAKMTGSFYVDTLVTMLIDHAVGFCVLGKDASAITGSIKEETHAQAVPLAEAAFVIVLEGHDQASLEKAFAEAHGGALIAPEQGATLIVSCTRLADRSNAPCDEGAFWVSVEGPGVETSIVFGVSDASWVWERSKRNDEYPCGIDLLLVDEDGRLVAIPRTSFVSLLATDREGLPWAM